MNRKGLVLVLEPDEQIRDLLGRWLREAGHDVLFSISDAQPPLSPRLVLVNIPTPRLGEALIRSLKAAYSVPILVLSGRFRRGLASSSDATRRLGVRGVLPKPFTRSELLTAVRETLEQ